MVTNRTTVQIDPDQLADIKEFLRRENSRALGLTPALADLALSLSGWVETTGPNDTARTFLPGAGASDDHPAAQLTRLRKRLERLDRDLGQSGGASVSIAAVRAQVQDMLK